MKKIFTKLNTLAVTLSLLLTALIGVQPAYASGNIVVNTAADDVTAGDTYCTLREAINNADADADTTASDCAAGSGPDTITFAADYIITLASALPEISTNVTIDGNGAANTIVQASACNPVTLSGGCTPATYRVIKVNNTGNLTLDNLTVRYGATRDGGGLYNDGGVLTLTNSVVSNNSAMGYGGGLYVNGGTLVLSSTIVSDNRSVGDGGGIETNGGTLTLTDCTLTGNQTSSANSGGGLDNYLATTTLTNCTLSGNSAMQGGGIMNWNDTPLTVISSTFDSNTVTQNGGGLYVQGGPTMVINSTFSGNTASGGLGGGIVDVGGVLTVTNSTLSGNSAGNGGGGLYTQSTDLLTLKNSIIANNTNGDCAGGSTKTVQYTLIEDGSCGISNGVNGNQTGDPNLGQLADNGGSTQTMALLAGSPAIDAGNDGVCPATDQRGVMRPQGMHCDIGAYESPYVVSAPTITSTNSATFTEGAAGSFTVTTAAGVPASTTIAESGALPGGVSFTDNGDGTAALSGTPAAGTFGTYDLTITASNGIAPDAVQNFTLNILPGTVQVTIVTDPSGLSFTVDGTTYTSSQTFTWTPGSPHTLSTTSPQAGTPGMQYAFDNWSDGGDLSHSVTAPATDSTYTATFKTQYKLTTAVNPSNGGNIAPASGTYFDANTDVSLTATANSGFTFLSWTGEVTDATSANTTITMSGPQNVTANFKASTSLLYNGDQLVNIGNNLKLAAQLTSPSSACTSGQTIDFSLDINPLDGSAGPYSLGSAVTSSNGQAALSVSTSGWLEGIYDVTASFAGTTDCDPTSDDATLTAANPGNSATGGGWYTLSGSGHINFGFNVRKVDNKCRTNCAYKGQLLLINNGKWRLKGTLDSYVKTSTGQGAASGTGDLYWWDQSLNDGLGDWSLAQSGVSFTINFYDSGQKGKKSSDTFGINIQYVPVSPQPNSLPNSDPQPLKGGDIKVN